MLLQEYGKVIEGVFNAVTNHAKQQQQWSPFGELGFVNRYREYEAPILAEFRNGDGQDFVARIQRDVGGLGLSHDIPIARLGATGQKQVRGGKFALLSWG